jgi:hypothetical protein
VFFAELADALAVPTFTHRLSLYVGHDGTLVRLLGALGAIPLRWPSFGSEVVLEVRTLCTRAVSMLFYSPDAHAHRFGRRLSVSVVGVSYAYFMKARSFVEWNGYNWMSL